MSSPGPCLWASACGRSASKFRQDLFILREAPDGVLRKDPPSVYDDVEDPVSAADQFGLDADFFQNPGRQTGGLGEEVSSAAVGDLDVHGHSLPAPRRAGSSFGSAHATR